MKKICMISLFIAVLSLIEIHFIPWMFDIQRAAAMVDVPDQDFSVKTFIKGDDVYIECYAKDYRFTQSAKKELASIAVLIDDIKQSEHKTAAFILKDLTNGKHTIKLELIDQNGEATGLVKEFQVHIQSAI